VCWELCPQCGGTEVENLSEVEPRGKQLGCGRLIPQKGLTSLLEDSSRFLREACRKVNLPSPQLLSGFPSCHVIFLLHKLPP
jgi:hypothetical protein